VKVNVNDPRHISPPSPSLDAPLSL
jgi:hypothetical protein